MQEGLRAQKDAGRFEGSGEYRKVSGSEVYRKVLGLRRMQYVW